MAVHPWLLPPPLLCLPHLSRGCNNWGRIAREDSHAESSISCVYASNIFMEKNFYPSRLMKLCFDEIRYSHWIRNIGEYFWGGNQDLELIPRGRELFEQYCNTDKRFYERFWNLDSIKGDAIFLFILHRLFISRIRNLDVCYNI